MKNLLIILSLLSSVGAFAQQQCPQIVFNYDASGNRILRKLVVTDCNSQRPNNPATNMPDPVVHVNVYPNPAQDKIYIEMDKDSTENESKVALYDFSGKEIYSTVTQLLQLQVDVSALSTGAYMLKINRGKKYSTYNISKN